MQRAGDARAFQRVLALEFLADSHQTGHFGLGNSDFLAAKSGLRHIGDFVISKFSGGVHHALLSRLQKKST